MGTSTQNPDPYLRALGGNEQPASKNSGETGSPAPAAAPTEGQKLSDQFLGPETSSDPYMRALGAKPPEKNLADQLLGPEHAPNRFAQFGGEEYKSDPFTQFGGSSYQPKKKEDPYLESLQNPSSSENEFERLGGELFSGGGNQQPASEHGETDPMSEDEPWYSRTWAYLNKPLYDAHQWGWKNGFGQGVEDLVTGLTSPLNLALTLGGLGSGALLDALGIAASDLPVAVKGLQALLDAGFSLQGAHAVLTQVPKALDALKFGDYNTFERLATDATAGTLFAAAGGMGAVKELGAFGDGLGWTKPVDQLEQVRAINGNRRATLEEHIADLRRQEKDLYSRFDDAMRKSNLTDKNLALGGMKRWMGVGGDAVELAKRRDALIALLNPEERAEWEKLAGKRPETGQPVREGEENKAEEAEPAEDITESKPELSGKGFQQFYSPKEKARLIGKYDLAQRLVSDAPALAKVAEELRGMFDADGTRAWNNGMLRHWIENYVTNVWRPRGEEGMSFLEKLFSRPSSRPLPNAPVEEVLHQAHSGAFDTDFPRARKRIFQSEFQGEMLGRKQAVDDPIALALQYRWQLEKALANREFLETLMDKNIQASDGRPIAAVAGNGRMVGEESGNPALFIDPDKMRKIQIPDNILQDLRASGKFDELRDLGKIQPLWTQVLKDGERKTIWGWQTGDYTTIAGKDGSAHPAFRGWNWVANGPDGTPIQMQGEVRIHPEAADYIRRAIGAEKSAIRETAAGRGLLAASGEAKHLLLSLSPFHLVQEGLRGVMAGINPFFSKLDLSFQDEPLLRTGVRNGLTLYKDYDALERYSAGANGSSAYSQEGVGGKSTLLNAVPGLRDIQDHLQNFLFDRYIPALKGRAFKAYFDRYRADMPAATPDEVARVAAERTNETFGGLNYVELGRHATSQDIFRLSALAPDWVESEIRLLGRALGFKGGTDFKISAIDHARILGSLWLTARLLNLLTNGQAHEETPFGVVHKNSDGSENVFSLRTLPTDLIHALSDPRSFLMGRMNPLTFRTGMEAMTGRDQYGRRVTPGGETWDFVQNIAPIPSQTALKHAFDQVTDLSNADQIAKASGVTVYRYRTEAEKVAQEKASDNSPRGPLGPAERMRHLRNIRLTDALRQGVITRSELYRDLPRAEATRIIDYATLTPLQARFKQLPLKDELDVWDVAMPQEKDELHKLLWNKRYYWLRAHVHGGRVDDPYDPTWIRLRAMFPDLGRIR